MDVLGGTASELEAALLDTLVASLDVGIVVKDADGRILFANSASERLLGRTREQMPDPDRTKGSTYLHADGWPLPPAARPSALALRSGRPVRGAVVGMKRPGGAVTWFSIDAHPLSREGEDRPYAVAIAVRDVTESRQADSAERRISERFRSLIEYSSDFVTILDEQSRIAYASPSVEKILGYPPSELQGVELFSFIHPDDSSKPGQVFARLLGRPGESASCECRFRARDGSWRITESIATNRLHDPAVMGIVVNTRDLSERRRAEAALRATTSRLANLVESLHAGVLVEDEDRRIALANAELCAIFGLDLPPAALAGTSCPDAMERARPLLAAPNEFTERIAELIAGRRPVRAEEIAFADGRTFERDYIPISAGEDDRGHIWIYRDISHRKEAELEAGRVRDEAIRASRVKSEFLATMSHEIRTPMSSVIGTLELLLDLPLPSEQEELARVARDSAYALLGVIDDVLDLSKIEAEKLTPRAVDFDLAEVLEGVSDVVLTPAHRKGLALTTYVDPRISDPLRGDAQWLHQVLLNLAGNAVKFTDEGEIQLRAELESQTRRDVAVRFAVSDSGVGIPEEARGRVFEPFSQLDSTSRRQGGGTGLGLAICQRLVGLMGGEIEVESAPRQGSTFHFALRFPRVTSERAQRNLDGLRVLIVAASESTTAVARGYLTAWGAESESAASATTAVELAARRVFDVAIVSTGLPEPAAEIAARLRAGGDGDGPAAILLRDIGPSEALDAMSPGTFVAELTKPLKQSTLFEAVVAAADPQQPTIGEEPDRLAPEPGGALAGVRALVAEDNEVNREILMRQLAKLGIAADGVDSGRAAIAAAARDRYDLVLMDCHMPEVDGFLAARAIRAAEGKDRRTPILAITASALMEDHEECLAAGMDGCLVKPVTSDVLEQALREALPSARGGTAGRHVDLGALDRLATDVGGTGELSRIVSIFVDGLPRAQAELRAALHSDCAAELERSAHKLASAGANFGAARLADLAARMEEIARSATTAGAAEPMDALDDEAAAVTDELRAWLGAQGANSSR